MKVNGNLQNSEIESEERKMKKTKTSSIVKQITKLLKIDQECQLIGTGVYTKAYNIVGENKKVLKIINGGEGKFNHDLAATMLQNIMLYEDILHKLGLHTPEIYKAGIWQTDNDDWEIVMLVAHGGTSLDQILQTADEFTCRKLTIEFLSAIEPVLKHIATGQEPIIGFDSKIANFTKNGCITNVDGMPPRINGFLDFPEPTNPQIRKVHYDRYYTLPGILLVALSQLSRIRPDSRHIFKDLIYQFADRFDISDIFHNSVCEQFVRSSSQQRRNIIVSLEPTNIYDFREIACELIATRIAYGNDGRCKEELETLYRLTHLYIEPNLIQNKKARAKLLDMAGLN